jgi:hypothetical protein
MPFLIDDAAIAAAAAAAAEAAAAEAAAAGAGVAASNAAAASAAEAAAASTAASAAPAIEAAPALASTDAGITSAMDGVANGVMAEAGGVISPVSPAFSSAEAAIDSGVADAAMATPALEAAPGAAPAVPEALPVTEIAPNAGTATVDAGFDAAAAPGAAPVEPAGTMSDTMSKYASDAGKVLTDPKVVVPAAMSGGSALWQQSILDAEQERLKKINEDSQAKALAKSGEISDAVNKWALENMSPEGMQANQDAAYGDLSGDYSGYLAAAEHDPGGPSGAMPSEYSAALAGGQADASQAAADYAKKMAKMQAPAFANLKSNIGELGVARTAGNALSDMRSAGKIGAIESKDMQGSNGLLGASALRGLGALAR